MIPVDAAVSNWVKPNEDQLIGVERMLRRSLKEGWITLQQAENARHFWGVTKSIQDKVEEMLKK